MNKGKWLYITHPDLPRSSDSGAPLSLTIRQEVDTLHNTLFKVLLSVKYRDEAKRPGYDEQVTVEWVQNSDDIDPVKFGKALIGLGEGLVKHGLRTEVS